jgi:hypothetical protein
MRQSLAAARGLFCLSIALFTGGATIALASTAKVPIGSPPYKRPHIHTSNLSAVPKAAQLYFFSMAPKATSATPKYVAAVRAASVERPAPIAGCDGYTYFLAEADAAALTSAITSGDAVQLHIAPQGTGNPSTLCVVQSGQ